MPHRPRLAGLGLLAGVLVLALSMVARPALAASGYLTINTTILSGVGTWGGSWGAASGGDAAILDGDDSTTGTISLASGGTYVAWDMHFSTATAAEGFYLRLLPGK